MANLYSSIGQNALRAKESSRFGTRPLAFYTVTMEDANNLASTWEDSNSLYYKIIQSLQEAGVELYYVGQPLNEDDGFGPADTESFIIAIADDADNPTKYLEYTNNWTVLGTNQDSYTDNYIKIDAPNPTLNRGQPVVFSETDGNIVAGQTYYLHTWETNGGFTYIRISETVSQINTDGTPDYPEGVGHPGAVVELTTSTNEYTATFSFYDTQWTGTAGDAQWVCCWDPDFKTINAWNLQNRIGDTVSLLSGSVSVLRCQVSAAGIFPLIGCCC